MMKKRSKLRKLFLITPLSVPIFLVVLLSFTPGISFSEDLARHLLLGKLILKNLAVPATNFLTYTYPNFPFINHHWLSQVILYVFHCWVGLNGLIVIKMLAMAFALGFAIFAIKCKRHQWLIWIAGILSAVILAYRAHIRPELISFIFVALLLLIFEKYRKGHPKFLWLVFPIMLIWGNAHIYFIFGLGMIGAFAIENWLKNRSQQTLKNEIIWVLAVVAVCLINPFGMDGLLFPFRIFNNYGVDITENASPLQLWETALNPMLTALPFLSLLTLFALIYHIFIWKRSTSKKALKNIRAANIIIATAALISAWIMARNTPLLAICALPVIITAANKIPKTTLKNKILQKWNKSLLYGAPAICSIILAITVIDGSFYRIFPSPTGPTPFGLDPAPERWNNISNLKQGAPSNVFGPVFCDYNIGSLVEYQIFPDKGYVDNRPEAFPSKFWDEEYFPAMTNLERFTNITKERNINWAVFSLIGVSPGLVQSLCKNKQWVVIHLDENVIVLMKKTESSANIIKNLQWDKKKIDEYERDISLHLLELPQVPWYYRQIATDILVFRLYSLICIGENQRAWPYIWQLHLMYPHYQAVHELMRVTAPPDMVGKIEPVYAARAHWPLSAKQVSDWANHLQARGKIKQALKTIKRGRIFFPLSPVLKEKRKQLNHQ